MNGLRHRVLTGLLALLVLAGCGQSAATTGTTNATSGALADATAAPAAEATSAPAAEATAEAPAAFTNPPASVRLGYFPNLTHAIGVVGVANGAFQKALGSVKLETKTFNAGPAEIEALFAGELDLAYVGPNPAINGYVKSKGAALRIIAGASSGGASFIVRPEASIKTAKDLDGKKLATPQLGGTQDVALRYYLQQNGLQTAEKGGTVQIVPTQNPDILTLFQQGQIDGAWVPEPWATRLIQEGKGQMFVDERTLWPDGKFVTTNVVVSKKFLDEHADIVAAFLKAHVETSDYIVKNADEAKKTVNSEIARITGKPLAEKVLDQAFTTLDITYDPLPKTLVQAADSAFALGFLGTEKPDLSGLFDLKPLNAVLKAKGLPEIVQ